MKIVYFAWLREKAGISEEDVSPPATVKDVQGLIEWLRARDIRARLIGFCHGPIHFRHHLFTSFVLLKNGGDSLPATYAHRCQRVLCSIALKQTSRLSGDARSTSSQWVAKGDCTSIDIDF